MRAPQATCVVISLNTPYRGKQEFDSVAGISAQTAGAAGLRMQTVTTPPKARAKLHLPK